MTDYIPPSATDDGWDAGQGAVPKPIAAEEHERATGHTTSAFHVGMSLEVDWQCKSMIDPFHACKACGANPHYGEEASDVGPVPSAS